jgi:hypothetical protein
VWKGILQFRGHTFSKHVVLYFAYLIHIHSLQKQTYYCKGNPTTDINFIYGLFNDTVNSLGCIVSNEQMII